MTDFRSHLVDIVRLADALNSRQHAGLPIPPSMWADLYQVCNKAKAALDETGTEKR